MLQYIFQKIIVTPISFMVIFVLLICGISFKKSHCMESYSLFITRSLISSVSNETPYYYRTFPPIIRVFRFKQKTLLFCWFFSPIFFLQILCDFSKTTQAIYMKLSDMIENDLNLFANFFIMTSLPGLRYSQFNDFLRIGLSRGKLLNY